ncbi:MAG: hypothetical protein EOM40_15765, partial [Clostridia bacterium]|nr:hypothetical protein [Clostridia bacterium]
MLTLKELRNMVEVADVQGRVPTMRGIVEEGVPIVVREVMDNFPNLPLMKLSAYHKEKGDAVAFAKEEIYDLLYISKIFTESKEPVLPVSTQIIRGGSGYDLNNHLPDEIEHMYPDYGLYSELTRETAYGFLTRGCPRNNHSFCITPRK